MSGRILCLPSAALRAMTWMNSLTFSKGRKCTGMKGNGRVRLLTHLFEAWRACPDLRLKRRAKLKDE